MAAESVKQRLPALSNRQDAYELFQLLAAVVNGIQALAAKLDADATVTDTNYLATFATHVTD